MDVNYFDAQHVAMNTINHHQIVDSANLENDNIPELLDNDTGEKTQENIEQYIQYKDGLETIPEENNKDFPVKTQGDGDDGDTIPYIQGDSEEEQFNTAIDDTSNDPMIKLLINSENSLFIFHQILRRRLSNRYTRYCKY